MSDKCVHGYEGYCPLCSAPTPDYMVQRPMSRKEIDKILGKIIDEKV